MRLRLGTYHVVLGLANFAKVRRLAKVCEGITICTAPPSSGWVVARTHIIKSVESGSIHIKVFWLTLTPPEVGKSLAKL